MTDLNKFQSTEFEEMKNKEKKVPSSSSVSELILSAVYFLQKKNGVSAKDITKYICRKRGLKQSQMKNKVKEALDRGIRNGIFNFKRGLYKVDENCKRKLTNLKKKIKKKSEVNKFQKKLTQKKVSMDKTVIKDKLTPINEDPDNSSLLTRSPRVRSHTLSEDVFDRRGRENSYFEPSVLARPSDEEYDDYDDEDNEDDEYSDMDEVDHRDIFMVTFADEASYDRFPDLNIYNAARQTKQKRVSTKRKGRNKTSSRKKGKKRKISRPRKKKLPEQEEKKKPKELESDDEDYLDEEESEYSEESDSERRKGKTKLGLLPEIKKDKDKKKPKLEENKNHKEGRESKENKETKDNKYNTGNTKKKAKQTTVLMTKKFKKSNCESSDENTMDENEENLMEKSGQSLSKSECMVTSSTKLLPSDFKLSISPNMIVSDVKFSPTNIKFETQDSSTVLLADTVKNEPADQELFNDFNIFCECQPPKRKNSADRDDHSSSMEAEPIQKRIKSKWSQI